MTAQEEPGVHHRSPAAEPASGERTARVSTLDVRSKERESEGQAKPIDFVTVAMFIIGKFHRTVRLMQSTAPAS